MLKTAVLANVKHHHCCCLSRERRIERTRREQDYNGPSPKPVNPDVVAPVLRCCRNSIQIIAAVLQAQTDER